MNSHNNIYRIFFLLLMVLPLVSFSQNNTSSPYSKFGAGDLSNVAYGRSLGLGGVGYGLRESSLLNIKNPASLTSIDTLSTLFELGVFGKFTQNSSLEVNQNFWDGNITHIMLGHRYTPWLMGSYGLMPFSDIGYNFRTYKTVEGELSTVVTDWKGTGGISKLFYALGLKLSKNLSLGGDIAYYYGPYSEQRKTTAMVEQGNPTYSLTNTRYRGISYKGAFQYTANLGDKGTNITLGGVFSPAQSFYGESTTTIDQSYSSSSVVQVYSKETSTDPIKIPMNYGVGGSFTWKGQVLLAVDYENSAWSNNNTRNYIDQSIYSFGIERLPQASLKYFDRCSYRVGYRYDTGYFTMKGKAIDDMRLTLGMGFPIKKSRSTINVSLEAGQRGTTQLGMLRERYTKMTVAFSFHDFWFVKRKID
ncbi:MAG: hypothetical protein PF541_16405 [Prolixibacteraceae bacterium]|jgi:hypothetical protein|nr:hypothetical protein [Prolixibacteraceae bacterium]